MPIGKQYYQDPNFVPYDIVEAAEEEDLQQELLDQWNADYPKRVEAWNKKATTGYYLELRRKKKLTHVQAALAADPEGDYYIMPAAKKATYKSGYKPKSGVIKAKKPYTKNATTTAGKSKASAIDLTKAIQAGVKKAMNGTIETQHSNIDILMHPQPSVPTAILAGINMTPLNVDAARNFNNGQMLAFNLSALCQVRGSTSSGSTSGWRNGFKVNAQSLRVDVRGKVTNGTVDCKYHAVLCRRKDGVSGFAWIPKILPFNEVALWRKNDGGPFAHEELHFDEPTLDKKNTECWSFVQGGHVEKAVPALSRQNGIRAFGLSMYKQLDTVWEFTTATATAQPNLKDGDYYLFLFREGSDDGGSLSEIRVAIDFAFKDA
jgi:hypothetical protein